MTKKSYSSKHMKGVSASVAGIIVVLLVVAVFLMNAQGYFSGIGSTAGSITGGITPQQPQPGQPSTAVQATCPTTLQTTVTPYLRNVEVDTSAQWINVSTRLVSLDSGRVTATSATDGAAAAAVTLNCGERYAVYFLAGSGANAVNTASYIVGVDAGNTIRDLTVSDGVAYFTTTGNAQDLRLQGYRKGIPEFRVWNNDVGAWACPNGTAGGVTGTYFTSYGYLFNSTCSSASTWTVGTAGQISARIDVRANSTDTSINDLGILVLVDASTSTWQQPSITFDGVALTNIKGSLTPKETLQYGSAYEYAFLIPAGTRIADGSPHAIGLLATALSGVNPTGASTDWVNINFVNRGRFLSVDGSSMYIGAATDDATGTPVYNGGFGNYTLSFPTN